MSDEVAAEGGSVETSAPADPVASANLPDSAKDFIRSMNEQESQAVEEAPKPAEAPPATADDDAQPATLPNNPRPAPAPTQPTLSEDQKRLIRDSYFSEEDVADMAPDQVDKLLAIVRKRDDRLVRSQRAQQRQREENGRFLPEQQPVTQQSNNRHKLSEEYDEEFHKAFNSRDQELDAISKELRELKEAYKAQQEQSVARQNAETIAWFDEQFSKLGDEFVPVLGKGTARDIDPRSAEFAARDAVVKTAYKLEEIWPEAGAEELFRKAVAANHSEILSKQHRAQLNGQLLKQSGRRLGAGSAVRAPAAEVDPLDPTGELKNTFNRMLQDNGSRA